MTLAGSSPKLEVVARSDAGRCTDCGVETDRLILFATPVGRKRLFECLDCRRKRVQEQVDAGLRPASDLLPENLPEIRNPL